MTNDNAFAPFKRFSQSISRIQLSAPNAANQRATELAAQGCSIVNLAAGEPDFDTPEHICEAAMSAIRNGLTRYTVVDGTAALKAAVARKFARDNDIKYDLDEISIGTGAKQILFNALVATIDAGDEVIIPTPSWVSYPQIASYAGGRSVMVPNVPGSFQATLDAIDEVIGPRTKWLILNSPNNPNGQILSADELRALADLLRRHPHVWIVCDDIYEHIRFDDQPFHTLVQVAPDLKERTLTLNGVSKAYAMTGWRIGFAGGPRELIKQMCKLQSQCTSGPNSVAQAAAIAALDGPQDGLRQRARVFQARRDRVLKEFATIPGLVPSRPAGAFYLFCDARDLLVRRTPDGNVIVSDSDLVNYLLMHAGVSTVVGSAFGAPGYVRLSIAASEEQLLEATRRLRRACGELTEGAPQQLA